MNLDLQAKITSWRHRAATGDLTLEEMQEAIKYLRAGRLAAASAASSSTSRRKQAAAAPAADDMLSELDGL